MERLYLFFENLLIEIIYSIVFVANNNPENFYLTVNDHAVSGEQFYLVVNDDYGFLETYPKPSENKLANYYKSEDYISHTDSRRNFFEKLYHAIRHISLNRKVRLLNSLVTNSKTLLDVGCGTGNFLRAAKKCGWQIYGIEPNEKAREIANMKTDTIVLDALQTETFKEHSFDVISLWHVLEHLPNLHEQLAIFKRLLKPNGILLVAVPNHKSFDALYYKSNWAAYDVPRHLWHFSRHSISKLVSKENMFVCKTRPMWFDAFYVSLLSEKYKTGRMNFIKAFLIGCLSNIKSLYTKEASSLIYVIKNKTN